MSFLELDVSLEGLASLCIGHKISNGSARDVYLWKADPKSETVIKVEKPNSPYHQNIAEFHLWQLVKDEPEVAKWFAPCLAMSQCGRYLLQKRTRKILHHQLPAEIPEFLTDLKPDNFGLMGDVPVAHDYGTHHMAKYGFNAPMVSPSWIVTRDM